MRKAYKIILLSLLFGAISGFVVSLVMLQYYHPSDAQLMKEWHAAEVAVHVSPHHIRKGMDKGDSSFVLVDLRSGVEYEREHIIGAVNVPAYSSPFKSAYGDVERIVSGFKAIQAEHPGKDIVVYCYSIPCMTGRKIGKLLSEFDISVQQLGVGWNEWRYFWTMWNHEHEWNVTNVEDYVISGSKPGVPIKKVNSTGCPIGGEFGC